MADLKTRMTQRISDEAIQLAGDCENLNFPRLHKIVRSMSLQQEHPRVIAEAALKRLGIESTYQSSNYF